MTKNLITIMEEYRSYESDPFSQMTIDLGNDLLLAIAENNQQKWCKMLETVDMTHNSKKAWKFIKRLDSDPTVANLHSNVTANQIAHQLLLNGKSTSRSPPLKISRQEDEVEFLSEPFTGRELQTALCHLKNGKAAGIDNLFTEQVKNFGPGARSWFLSLLNNCVANKSIPKAWRKSHVIALLKPGKTPDDPKNYRPISLLCHLFKIFERLILNRMTRTLDDKLIPQQAGFRPGKSCTSQALS
ncbi:hypothetical protein JYU34_003184 [Plutella xylostella]|uniref:Reverse transcriptase domain-containing protein n=1 Tax=Plutella xylostella TaxID=51655 RepID=A0ABQ7QZH6_PLUXY|nr:hypothetical protein JYU34_003184 [Plutella xylostella]